MKTNKVTVMDKIPSEVWQHSKVTQKKLYVFIEQVWRKEYVPVNLIVCIFVIIYIQLYIRKGSHNDFSKYRTIGLLNHTYTHTW